MAALAVVLAGCGSSYGGASGGSTPTSGTSPQTIATTSGPLGTYLTTSGGRSVYLWLGDHGMASSCSGACATVWPPVTTMGKPTAGSGVTAADLGTIKRSDGSTQVTYKGHPLYYYASDSSSGETNGEGINGFGALWYLVTPSGNSLKSGSNPSSSSSSGGYNY